MNPPKIVEEIDFRRRDLVGGAAVAATAAQLGIFSSAAAQTAAKTLPAVTPGARTSFGPLKQIDAGVLNVAYAEAGPAHGPPATPPHRVASDTFNLCDVAPSPA